MSPSDASRELFLAARACPLSRSTRLAPSRSPPDSSSAFLTSIMPAAVSSRSCFIFSIVLTKTSISPRSLSKAPRQLPRALSYLPVQPPAPQPPAPQLPAPQLPAPQLPAPQLPAPRQPRAPLPLPVHQPLPLPMHQPLPLPVHQPRLPRRPPAPRSQYSPPRPELRAPWLRRPQPLRLQLLGLQARVRRPASVRARCVRLLSRRFVRPRSLPKPA